MSPARDKNDSQHKKDAEDDPRPSRSRVRRNLEELLDRPEGAGASPPSRSPSDGGRGFPPSRKASGPPSFSSSTDPVQRPPSGPALTVEPSKLRKAR